MSSGILTVRIETFERVEPRYHGNRCVYVVSPIGGGGGGCRVTTRATTGTGSVDRGQQVTVHIEVEATVRRGLARCLEQWVWVCVCGCRCV